MFTRLCAFVLLFASFGFAQSAGFSVDSPDQKAAYTAVVSYALPADNPSLFAGQTDPAQAPAKIFWYWGDDEIGATKKNVTETAYAAVNQQTHVYKKPGRYSIMLVIVDAKNRLIINGQVGTQVEVSHPVKEYKP